jgi:outer membrane protein assembly factor BamB
LAAALFADEPATASDWTRFRGPGGAGVSPSAPSPLELRQDSGFVWKRSVPPGKSSPVLAGNRLFYTAFEGERLITTALDRTNGETLWSRELRRLHVDERNDLNDPAVPTPTTDGESLYVFFADFGLAAYSVDGEELWRRPLGPFRTPHGIATSPLLIDGILVVMLEQLENGAIIGVDASNGEILWSHPRPPSLGGSYATPVAFQPAGEKAQAVLMFPFEIVSYDPRSGEQLWRVGGLPHQPKSSPFVAGDLVIAGVQGDNARLRLKSWEEMSRDLDKDGSGVVEGAEIRGSVADYDLDGVFGRADYDQWHREKSPPSLLLAIRPNGRGDLTETAVEWSTDRGVPRVTTPLAYQGHLYMVRNGGIFASLDLVTGEPRREGRLRDGIDEYFASPVAAGGKILVVSRSCQFTWIEPGAEWKALGTSKVEGECFATPALADDGIFIRTSAAIYRSAAVAASD